MDALVQFFEIFVNKFLAQPALLMGTIVFIGYLLLGKKIYEALSGFIKAYVGYAILQVGTAGLVSTFSPVIEALQKKFGISAYVMDPYFSQSSGESVLNSVNSLQFVGYVMLIAFFINIILVFFKKYTKCRSLFLTGHIMYQQAVFLLWGLYWVIYGATGDQVSMLCVLVTGVLLGVYWSVGSNLIIEQTNEVSDGANFTVGHQQMFGSWFTYKLGGWIGNKKHSTEDIEMPGFMSIFKDSIVSNALIMTVFIAILMIITGPSMYDYDPEKYTFGTYIFFTGASFAVYITIILTGVRIFITELTQSFTGISNKLLKGSVPGVDCPVLFGFRPNTPIYGFIMGFIGQILAIGFLILIGSPILILSGFIVLFFDNGTLAVYANESGGRKAATIIPFCAGIIQVLGSAFVLHMLGDGPGVIGWVGEFDWVTLAPVLLVAAKYIGLIAAVIAILIMLIIPHLQYRRNKENYFTTMRYREKK